MASLSKGFGSAPCLVLAACIEQLAAFLRRFLNEFVKRCTMEGTETSARVANGVTQWISCVHTSDTLQQNKNMSIQECHGQIRPPGLPCGSSNCLCKATRIQATQRSCTKKMVACRNWCRHIRGWARGGGTWNPESLPKRAA